MRRVYLLRILCAFALLPFSSVWAQTPLAVGGIVELLFGVKAEQVPLENIAKPLTAEEAEHMPEREREGRRRYRPGPGLEYPYYSPGLMGTSLRRPTALAELQQWAKRWLRDSVITAA